ncbi:Very-long-chain (3R)-3-hydroxyacyl-CoA dehydratase [Rhynchospora pubera]|uniref:Very-long-chain (3R)-3-hydroxyacyl-CoA dehydratase n=1 Tax=Rhynchospora pubera TaxID=906938 RepID=A0AAV8HP97_9POAL|nr:Very-long-chain (3R)-3-hydroxyacyl-CoA dehydratase [Rhynchospora pubera]KAJ4819718.1 Very-long-chain (3R)-3-hydroxyacyl-CoA dehydratase [Rhynchospora pubera]
MLRLSQLYLLAYNSLQFLGWSIALIKILLSLSAPSSFHGAYATAGDIICLLQAVSFLETIHAVVGLVPAGFLLTLMQWGGRTHFLLAIVRQITEVQSLPSVLITFAAWSLSEVIRYSHYALSTLKICPSWLTYFRYTAFIFLYPIGVGPGEMWLMYQALPYIEERNLYSDFFNKFGISYYSFVVAALVCYPFLWLKLYLHLFKQRRSKLKKKERKKKL